MSMSFFPLMEMMRMFGTGQQQQPQGGAGLQGYELLHQAQQNPSLASKWNEMLAPFGQQVNMRPEANPLFHQLDTGQGFIGHHAGIFGRLQNALLGAALTPPGGVDAQGRPVAQGAGAGIAHAIEGGLGVRPYLENYVGQRFMVPFAQASSQAGLKFPEQYMNLMSGAEDTRKQIAQMADDMRAQHNQDTAAYDALRNQIAQQARLYTTSTGRTVYEGPHGWIDAATGNPASLAKGEQVILRNPNDDFLSLLTGPNGQQALRTLFNLRGTLRATPSTHISVGGTNTPGAPGNLTKQQKQLIGEAQASIKRQLWAANDPRALQYFATHNIPEDQWGAQTDAHNQALQNKFALWQKHVYQNPNLPGDATFDTWTPQGGAQPGGSVQGSQSGSFNWNAHPVVPGSSQ